MKNCIMKNDYELEMLATHIWSNLPHTSLVRARNNYWAPVLGTCNAGGWDKTIFSFREHVIYEGWEFFSLTPYPSHRIPPNPSLLSTVCLSCFWIFQSSPQFGLQAGSIYIFYFKWQCFASDKNSTCLTLST